MRGIWILAPLLAFAGCSFPVTVTLKDGGEITGPVSDSQADRIFVAGQPINRADIEDIDHPGNGAAGVGIGMAFTFGLCTVIGAVKAAEGGSSQELHLVLTLFSATLLATGGGLAAWGLVIWNRSVDSVEPPPGVSARAGIMPLVASEQGRTYGGAGVWFRW